MTGEWRESDGDDGGTTEGRIRKKDNKEGETRGEWEGTWGGEKGLRERSREDKRRICRKREDSYSTMGTNITNQLIGYLNHRKQD